METQQKLFPPAKKKKKKKWLLWRGRIGNCFKVENVNSISKRTARSISALHSRHYFPETTSEGFHFNHLSTMFLQGEPHMPLVQHNTICIAILYCAVLQYCHYHDKCFTLLQIMCFTVAVRHAGRALHTYSWNCTDYNCHLHHYNSGDMKVWKVTL